jgi:hypothetical protein
LKAGHAVGLTGADESHLVEDQLGGGLLDEDLAKHVFIN